jgi:glycerol-3-phosphate acyltransferase PlsY
VAGHAATASWAGACITLRIVPVLSILLAYCIGSIPFALLMARRAGAGDLHHIGSGNIGAANVVRASGLKAGLLVAVLDVAKGAAGVFIVERLNGSAATQAAAGLAAILGHVYPVWLRFRGGKGVATACGAFSLLTPLAILPALGLFVVGIWLSKYVSVGSVAASIALPPIAYFSGSPFPAVLSALGAATVIVFRHRSNLARVRFGTERRLGVRA